MVITVIPMALNVLTCVTVWMSNLSFVSKIIITVILVAKVATYFCSALMDASDSARAIGFIICAVGNILLVAFFVWKAVWTAIGSCAILAILAVVWGGIFGFSFKKENTESQRSGD